MTKTIVLASLFGACLVLSGFLFVTWDLILGEWYIHRLDASAMRLRDHAAERLGSLRSRKAIPFLLAAVDQLKVSPEVAAEALKEIGEPAVEELIDALRTGHRSLQTTATEALIEIRPDEYKGCEAVMRKIAFRDFDISTGGGFVPITPIGTAEEVFFHLGSIEHPPRGVMALLAGMVMNEGQVGTLAAQALACMGPIAREEVPTLLKALEYPRVGGEAALALAHIAPGDPGRIVPAITEAGLKTDDRSVRSQVCQALARFGPTGNAAIPAVRSKGIEDGPTELRGDVEEVGRVFLLHLDRDLGEPAVPQRDLPPAGEDDRAPDGVSQRERVSS